MAEVFNWNQTPGASGKFTLRTKRAQFGDGYAQTMPDGINCVTQSWPLMFEGNLSEIGAIRDFLARNTGKSFLWTPPGGDGLLLWQSSEFSMTSMGAGVYSITVEFVQHFSP